MEHTKYFNHRLVTILFAALFLISGNSLAAGACSSYMGQASLNEFFKDLTTQEYSVNDFVEVKILNGSILPATFDTWKIKLCEKFDGGSQSDNDGCSAAVSLSSFTNRTKPWLVIDGTAVTGSPATNIEIGKYINFKTGFDAILLDANDDIIDYVTVSGYSPQLASFSSCASSDLPFDWQFSYSGASPKLMFRSPDGIGKWHGKTSAVAPGTVDSTNDSGAVGKSEWYMDELSWNSTTGEVTDQSTNLNHGTAYNGLSTVTPGKLCNGGSFDGINDYIEIPHNDTLQGSATLTYAAWINPSSWSGSGINQVMAKSVHGGTVTKSKTPRAQMGIFSENNRLVGRAETVGDVRHEVFTSLPATSSWTHVALVFNGNSLTFYINGVVAPNADGSHRSTKSFAATTLVQNNDPLMISKRVGSNEYYFHGLIDEVLVFQPALQAPFIQTMYTNYSNGLNWDGAARSCSGSLHHFEIRHDGSGLTCEPENIYVKACTDANCTSLYPYDITVTPSPASSATTSWAPAPQVISANTENTLKLSYKSLISSPSDTVALGITGSSPSPASATICKDLAGNVTNCNMIFYDSGFTYSIPTQLACETSATPVTIRAVRKDLTSQQCVALFTGNQAKTINFTVSPAPAPDIIMNQGQTNQTTFSSAAATQAVDLNFNNSEATFTLTHDNAGQFTLNASHTDAGLTLLGTSNFIVRPHSFLLQATYDNAGTEIPLNNTAATGSPYWKASDLFRLRIRGQCADGRVTTNYNATNAQLFAELAAPDETLSGNHSNLTINSNNYISSFPSAPVWHDISALFSNGAVTIGANNYANAAFHEVGILNLHVKDDTYSVPQANLTVGRFTPHHFDTLITHGCSGSTFTYSGQPFRVTAAAMNNLATPTITKNYQNSFAKLTTLSNQGVTTNFSNNTIAATSFAAGFAQTNDPATLPSSSITYTFPVKDTIPALLKIRAYDADTTTSVGTTEETTQIRSGRIRLESVFGPELTPLSMPLYAEYYSDNATPADLTDDGYVLNSDDSCSAYDAPNGTLANYTGNLSSGEVSVTGSGTVSSGIANIIFHKPADSTLGPGFGNEGSVNLLLNNLSDWLTYDWAIDCNGDAVNDNTACGTASFGLYRGDDRIIYWREVF